MWEWLLVFLVQGLTSSLSVCIDLLPESSNVLAALWVARHPRQYDVRQGCVAHGYPHPWLVNPAGGPSGGDGGHGGNVWVEAEAGLTSLTIFRRQLHFRADKGGPGTGSNKHGANGPDLVIKVSGCLHADRYEDWCNVCVSNTKLGVVQACRSQGFSSCRDEAEGHTVVVKRQ